MECCFFNHIYIYIHINVCVCVQMYIISRTEKVQMGFQHVAFLPSELFLHHIVVEVKDESHRTAMCLRTVIIGK